MAVVLMGKLFKFVTVFFFLLVTSKDAGKRFEFIKNGFKSMHALNQPGTIQKIIIVIYVNSSVRLTDVKIAMVCLRFPSLLTYLQ